MAGTGLLKLLVVVNNFDAFLILKQSFDLMFVKLGLKGSITVEVCGVWLSINWLNSRQKIEVSNLELCSQFLTQQRFC
jgi:hypothetical protein